jgi:hypothetical protein
MAKAENWLMIIKKLLASFHFLGETDSVVSICDHSGAMNVGDFSNN